MAATGETFSETYKNTSPTFMYTCVSTTLTPPLFPPARALNGTPPPPPPQAAFFSYLGPDNRTDIGRTRHSGCPILKGTKWIATLWMRRGVQEQSWEYFDPSGDPSE